MSVARERALTHCCNDLVLRNVVFVEMSVARERALTPPERCHKRILPGSRNECCP